MKYTIGEVGFAKEQPADCDGARCFLRGVRPHLHRLPLMGDERVAMLQLALDQQPLPAGVVFVTVNWLVRITWSDVRWDTSGLTPSKL